jgi:hypothetical protein
MKHFKGGENKSDRRMNNEKLHNLYSSPDIIRQMKSRRINLIR